MVRYFFLAILIITAVVWGISSVTPIRLGAPVANFNEYESFDPPLGKRSSDQAFIPTLDVAYGRADLSFWWFSAEKTALFAQKFCLASGACDTYEMGTQHEDHFDFVFAFFDQTNSGLGFRITARSVPARPFLQMLHIRIPLWVVLGISALGTAIGFLSGRLLRRLRRYRGRCEKCSYLLTGNQSGVCPECGLAFRDVGPVEAPDGEGIDAD